MEPGIEVALYLRAELFSRSVSANRGLKPIQVFFRCFKLLVESILINAKIVSRTDRLTPKLPSVEVKKMTKEMFTKNYQYLR